MSRPTILRQRIEDIVDALAESDQYFAISDVLTRIRPGASRQYVHGILRQQVATGRLTRRGRGRGVRYRISSTQGFAGPPLWHKRLELAGQTDYQVLEQFYQESPQVLGLSEDVRSIFAYAFTEMLNNAIEHSKSKDAELMIYLQGDNVRFVVRDFGIGVFKNVMAKYHLSNELEAIQELLKGKTTTAPQLHSGEGIFFTSKIADLFVLSSYSYSLRIDNRLPDIFVEPISKKLTGTEVIFQIAVDSPKHLNDIFQAYQSPTDLAFDKTRAYIKLFTAGTIYVSRSQAKRVLSGIPERNFREIVLDFAQVPTIGQAFADEIFRVFASSHPQIKLTSVNANEAVTFMINRVQSPERRQNQQELL